MSGRAIDLVHLARQTGGDEQLEQELLVLFADQCDRQITIIRTAADMLRRVDAAHTLKGAARAIGAWHVADAAQSVETLLESAPAQGDIQAGIITLSAAAEEARCVISALGSAA